VWHTAEDIYVPLEHTYRFAAALAAHLVPHAVHVFAHGPHSLRLAQGAGDAETWTALAASWIDEQIHTPSRVACAFETRVRSRGALFDVSGEAVVPNADANDITR
jgi:hypothetical protein